ncbi:uncharacterized protein LOC135827245 [Sycon ciliatum]|uniref:uncharacterized protein LOC135827245 n=1 Tax=Sycon ciliatum TaxID=27933 RepID=UPI0031F64D5D
MVRFQPAAAFNFSSPDRWPAWKLRFSRFRMPAKLSTETEEIQVSTLLYSLGPDADPVFEYQLGLSDAYKRKYAEVVEAFDTYFRPATNVIHERAQFKQLIQRPGQTLEEFVRDLYKGAEFCDFGGEKDNRIRDRIVAHMCNKRVSREIQMKEASEQTLAKAPAYARQAEKVEDQVAAQGRSAAASLVSEPVSSSAVSHRPGNSGRKQPTQQQPNSGAHGECLDCDRAHAQAHYSHRHRSADIPVYVLEGATTCLLSRSACSDLGLIQGLGSVHNKPELVQCMKGPAVNIQLTSEATPYHCMTAHHFYFKVRDELSRMEEGDIIAKVVEPTDWCSPIVPVLKPNGKVRICVDLKHLKACVKQETFQLPKLDDALASLASATLFSTLDAAKGFGNCRSRQTLRT